ncbi:isoprenylcysteine carboxylmethyltransferase family protein [Marichromatium gracile]|uniref:Protein-S-isoprenylcysteine methyltransferase n=1 Tax=Marichromatium gracile TaxID=1048 RepID=A0ABR5VCQ9_MARGR|nr:MULTISPECIES: isoprenylcysteine carboxylmethyltransferase family protein [Marichromatium]KXX63428.1 protein-S-isoprenylcysteine methyltransferase [Marichromatium gracile]MBO8087212.1 isoprenylcysteine carboxylmethyltransferase family protein [Marichromatium sp.]MCF1183145.1 isoprenylcysteine carboxylmethyltransferase family protein [Marichromatium gracile]RNE89834.1 isoprenylcysteine carboxylmethyltransferase family protein [Marichromatium sp. AB31]
MSLLSRLQGRRGEHLVVLQFVLFFGFVLTPSWNPWLTPGILEAMAPLRWAVLIALGTFAMVLGAVGSMHIRDYLTPLPYPVEHNQLVQHGIYALVRHPLYSSQLFAALAWVLFSLSLTHLAILVIGFLFFDYKAGKEEGWLRERHPEYADYARRVSKFIPWIY